MRLVWLLIFGLLLGAAPSAHADSDERAAKRHFARGKSYIKQNKYDDAIRELEAAYQLDPKNEHLYNLGVAHHLKGDKKVALDYYTKFLATNPRGSAGRDATKYAEDLQKEIAAEEQAARDAVAKPVPKGDVDRDGDGIPDATDKCPVEAEDVDLFEDTDGCAEADNDKDGVFDKLDKCTMQAEDKDGVDDEDGCPDLDDDGDGFVATDDLCPEVAGDVKGCVSKGRGTPLLRWAGIGVGGAGLVLVGVGVVFGLQAKSAESDVSGASDRWSLELDQRIDDGKTANRRMKTFMLIGAGTLVVGGALFVLGMTVGGGEITPSVGKESASVTWTRRF